MFVNAANDSAKDIVPKRLIDLELLRRDLIVSASRPSLEAAREFIGLHIDRPEIRSVNRPDLRSKSPAGKELSVNAWNPRVGQISRLKPADELAAAADRERHITEHFDYAASRCLIDEVSALSSEITRNVLHPSR